LTSPPARRRFIVGAVKIPHARRDVAHAVITPDDDRGFLDLIGANTPDDHDVFPVGAHTTYAVELTEEEAERFRRASNCRYCEPDSVAYENAVAIPSAATMRWMDAAFTGVDTWHGRDVLIGLLDGGTSTAVRNALGVTMVARQNFQADDPGADEVTSAHGCLVAPCLIPQGGKFLDAIVSNNAGILSTSGSVAAATWCADNGAKIINYSASMPDSDSAWNDMMQYLLDRGVQFFGSMGNDNLQRANYPAALSTSYANCHSSISFDKTTGKRSTFSNYTATASGCAPGTNELGLTPTAGVVTWSGTSASTPHMARLCAMGATGGTYTAAQVGAALKANCRDTGQPDAEQGGGAYDLQAALTALGAFNPATGGDPTGADYHPVAIIWPASDKWPDDGEYDFMENGRPGDDHGEAYLHYPHSSSVPVQQEHATKADVDLSQWHNFAIEKGPDGITGYLDGTRWFHYAGGAIAGTRKNIQDMPSGHLTLQLDNFNGSSGNIPATMEIDWVRAYSLTPQGGGGSTGTLADRLRIGFGDGLTKCNIGVDFLPGQGPSGKQGQHVDYPLSVLTQTTLPAELAGYVDLRDDGAVRLTAYVGAATTPNSTHSRVEQRALAQNGVDKESFTADSSSTHYAWGDIAVIRAPSGRPRICLLQIHTSSDDLCMILWEAGTVFSTYGDTGRPGTLATGVAYGSRHQLMIKLEQGKIKYYWDDMTTPGATQGYSGGSGLYRKGPGCYQQSSTSTDPVGEMATVDVYDMEYWSSGMPEPAARHG
jgi:hypothetical protein